MILCSTINSLLICILLYNCLLLINLSHGVLDLLAVSALHVYLEKLETANFAT